MNVNRIEQKKKYAKTKLFKGLFFKLQTKKFLFTKKYLDILAGL